MKILVALAILIMGMSGLVAQMVLLRELLIVFSGNELSIGIVLANWLILEAFGCFFLGRRVEKTKNKLEAFISLTFLFSLSLPVGVYLTRILKNILGISLGESLGFLPMLYSSFLILLPTSISHGALFTFSCQIYSVFFTRDASSIGKVYLYETIGTIAGGIIWTYLLIPYLHTFQIIGCIWILNLSVGTALIAPYWKSGKLQKIITVTSCLFLTLGSYSIFGGGADKLHQLSIKAQWRKHYLVHYQNSIYGNISIVENQGQYIFFLDGIPKIITPVPDIGFVEEFVHLPLLTHRAPQKILILSGGAGGVINEILKHPSVKEVEYLELDPLLLELIRKFSTPLTEKELTDRRVKIKHIDGRLFFKVTRDKYDLIFVGLKNPANLRTNRFFTKEFFAIAKKRLTKDGILVITLPGSLTYLTNELKNLNACIFNTLKSVFPYVRVFPGDNTNLFLSSNSKGLFSLDKLEVVTRLNERNIKTAVPVARHIEKKLHPGWQEWFLELLKGSTRRLNYDFQPVGTFYSISHWSALFSPYLRGLFNWLEGINLWLFFALFIIFIGFFFLAHFKNINLSSGSIPLCIATTGFAGMIFDLGLIFTFQSIYGYVFSWIGLLVTSFMTGTAAGAMIITSLLSRIKDCLKFFIRIDLTIICFSFGLPFVFLLLYPSLSSSEIFLSLRVLFLILSFVCGILIGAQFPLANKISLSKEPNLSKTAGLLYSSDLVGGWLGGIVGSLVLLPLLGLLGSWMVVVLLKLGSFITVTSKSSLTK
jgi:spermidine synthase